MPNKTTEEEQLASTWLQSKGFKPEFEPAIVAQGRRPDFLAKSTAAEPYVWAEVKTLDPEIVTTNMRRAADIITQTTLPDGLLGYATMYVNENTKDQSIRAVLKLFAEHAPKYRDKRAKLVFIQQAHDISGMRRIDILDSEIPEHFWVRGAGQGPIGAPPGVLEDLFRLATVWDGRPPSEVRAYNIFSGSDANCTIAAHLNEDDHPLRISPMGGGIVDVASRILQAVESANRQIRNACKYLSAPGVVLIFPPLYGFIDDQQIGTAVYGKLRMYINVRTRTASPLEHGPDAAFQSGKNRHISAVIRMNRDGRPGTFFPNFHAHHELDRTNSLLAGLACYPPAAG